MAKGGWCWAAQHHGARQGSGLVLELKAAFHSLGTEQGE